MLNIFLSYNRKSEAVARILVSDIESLGHVAWFDQDLSGGQAWWDQILEKIRNCDVLAFLMDAHSVESTACKRELDYALALRKTILPIMAADGVLINLLPKEISEHQFIDYRNQDRDSIKNLAKALNKIPPAGALPDRLPRPPVIPVSYLGGLTKKIDKTSGLSLKEQDMLLAELKRSLREPGAENETLILLKRFRSRRDIYAAVAEDIDELIGKHQKISNVSPAENVPEFHPENETIKEPEIPQQPVEPEPVPELNNLPQPDIQQDAIETGIIPGGETPPQNDSHPTLTEKVKATNHKRLKSALIGTGAGLVLAMMFALIPYGRVGPFIIAIYFGIAGAITGAICGNQKRIIVIAIAGAFAVFTLWALLDHSDYYYSEEYGREEYINLGRAIIFGPSIGAILGAIIGSFIKRHKT